MSTLRVDVRRSLLGAWMQSGGRTAVFFTADSDSLVDFIAEQLPDPSPELALCRVEQLTLRAAYRAGAFRAPDPAHLNEQRLVKRACHAGIVLFPAGSDLILSRLLPYDSLQVRVRGQDATPLLVAPGMQPLCRVASRAEHEVWSRLVRPMTVDSLVPKGAAHDAVATLLRVGALEYA